MATKLALFVVCLAIFATLCRTQSGLRPNDCAINPCVKGICMDEIGSYRCDCGGTDTTGAQCEIDLDECESSPCLNGGVCLDLVSMYKCFCAAGFEGPSCETNINECLTDPLTPKCLNNGVCIDGLASYTCDCSTTAFTGGKCEIAIDDCSPNPCYNNGRCVPVEGASVYQCQCRPGFGGTRCQTNFNECMSSPCRNTGVCVDGIASYTCKCNPEFTGSFCESPIRPELRVGAITVHALHVTWDPNDLPHFERYRLNITDISTGITNSIDLPSTQTTYIVDDLAEMTSLNVVLEVMLGGVPIPSEPVAAVTKRPDTSSVRFHGATGHALIISWSYCSFPRAEKFLISVIGTKGHHARLVTVDADWVPTRYTITGLPRGEYEVGVDAVVEGERIVVGALANSVRTGHWVLDPRPPYVTIMNQKKDSTIHLAWSPVYSHYPDNYIIRYGALYGDRGRSRPLKEVVLNPNVFSYLLPKLSESHPIYTVQIFSSVGARQEWRSRMGKITPFGNFSVNFNLGMSMDTRP